ncbi:hypothetical protein DSUL_60011 [Desulfovibrionales bacterium]
MAGAFAFMGLRIPDILNFYLEYLNTGVMYCTKGNSIFFRAVK